MAKNKKWVDCPICGEVGSMRIKKNLVFDVTNVTLEKVYVKGLSGSFCNSCGEGFYDIKSKNKINQEIVIAKAKARAKAVRAFEIEKLETLAKVLHTTKQYAIQAMKEGKIPSVIVAGEMKPFHESLEQAKILYSNRVKRKKQLSKA